MNSVETAGGSLTFFVAKERLWMGVLQLRDHWSNKKGLKCMVFPSTSLVRVFMSVFRCIFYYTASILTRDFFFQDKFIKVMCDIHTKPAIQVPYMNSLIASQ